MVILDSSSRAIAVLAGRPDRDPSWEAATALPNGLKRPETWVSSIRKTFPTAGVDFQPLLWEYRTLRWESVEREKKYPSPCRPRRPPFTHTPGRLCLW